MDTILDYTGLLTSYHKGKPKLAATLTAVLQPLLDARAVIAGMPALFDVDTATGDQLRIIALWVGAPLAIPNVIPLPFFGFADQEAALTFGETDNPDIGGFWRESGVSSFKAINVPADLMRQVIQAQIYRNHCEGLTADGYHIISILTDLPVKIIDTQQMEVIVEFLATPMTLIVELVRLMYPKPMGVSLTIIGNI